MDMVYRRLLAEPYQFDFFQACRLLGRIRKDLVAVGPDDPLVEPARFKGHLSLNYPASPVHAVAPGAASLDPPAMTITFLGLFGPKGVLPWHYTQKLIDREHARADEWDRLTDYQREQYAAERTAARAWLDLFNHRFAYLFYRAWDKYRFWLAYERAEPDRVDPDEIDPGSAPSGSLVGGRPDPFTRCLLALSGLGTGGLRNRIVVTGGGRPGTPATWGSPPVGCTAGRPARFRGTGCWPRCRTSACSGSPGCSPSGTGTPGGCGCCWPSTSPSRSRSGCSRANGCRSPRPASPGWAPVRTASWG